MILYDSRATNSPSPRIRRAKTPFARLCSFDGQTPNCASRQYRSRPCRQLSPATRLPSCAQNFFARSLVNARATLAHLSYERSCLCHPFNRRRKASSAAHARPPRPRARPSPATRLPSCAQNFFAQSLVNSRVSLAHLSYVRSCLSTPPSAAKGPPARPVRRHRVSRDAPKISCPISHNLS